MRARVAVLVAALVCGLLLSAGACDPSCTDKVHPVSSGPEVRCN